MNFWGKWKKKSKGEGERMIKSHYDDGKDHIHVLSFGAGTQSTAMLLMALKGEFNGVIPDYIIFSDPGWEQPVTYDWINKINDYIKIKYNREIIVLREKSIREDILRTAESGGRLASLPFFTKDKNGKIGMVLRQCTGEYKIDPIKRHIRTLLGYKPRQHVKEIVHMWKGISTDEIQRVKPIQDKWIEAEHPLIDIKPMNRSNCIAYVEREGLGTPVKSSCIGCPFHDNGTWLEIKKTDPASFEDACLIDEKIRNLPGFDSELYLHKSGKPLRQVDLNENQLTFDDFINECEGFCGV